MYQSMTVRKIGVGVFYRFEGRERKTVTYNLKSEAKKTDMG